MLHQADEGLRREMEEAVREAEKARLEGRRCRCSDVQRSASDCTYDARTHTRRTIHADARKHGHTRARSHTHLNAKVHTLSHTNT